MRSRIIAAGRYPKRERCSCFAATTSNTPTIRESSTAQGTIGWPIGSPMPVLANAKHERFAQALAKGKTADDAYELAGYSANRGNAIRLKANERVAARIDEILNNVSEKAAVSKAKVIEELSKIGFSNMLDYIRIDPEGQPYTDFSALTREQAAAIQEVFVETRTEIQIQDGEKVSVPVRKVKFKLSDKRAALVDIGKELGMFKEKIEHSGTLTLESLVGASYDEKGEGKN